MTQQRNRLVSLHNSPEANHADDHEEEEHEQRLEVVPQGLEENDNPLLTVVFVAEDPRQQEQPTRPNGRQGADGDRVMPVPGAGLVAGAQ